MSVNLNGTAVVAVVGLAAGVVTIVLAWPRIKALLPKIDPTSRDNLAYQATGEVGLHIADWFGGAFKSGAEKDVDKMLANTRPPLATATTPAKKDVITPANASVEFVPRSYYDLGAKPAPWYTPTRYYDLGAKPGTGNPDYTGDEQTTIVY